MSIQFIWEDKYSVGNPTIDNQHKGMFELGNDLPEVLNAQEIKPIIMRLYKYTREHFSLEEEMMKSIRFPLLAEHITLHEEVISKLNETSSRPFNTDKEVLRFKQFIYGWLIEHILSEDMQYFKFSQKQS
jgi:hemerythrin